MATNSERITEIYDFVLPEMAKHGIEDTTDNRIAFLTGLKDGWLEDPEEGLEKTLYVIALVGEIGRLQIRLRREAFALVRLH